MTTITDTETASPQGAYWDQILDGWEPNTVHTLWRAHSDAVNLSLLRRWLPRGCGRVLKTDLFDEAIAAGLFVELAARASEVVGVDVSAAAVRAATERHPGLEAHVASVLALPFADASFDAVVSNSTLDHFESRATIGRALVELARILRPGGELIITLDNRVNPVIALRTSRSLASVHRRLGLVPYYVGATCGARGLSNLLLESGFAPRETTAIMHCPPQLAAKLASRSPNGSDDVQAEHDHLRRVLRWERMERWPTRHLSGHFVAVCAVKSQRAP